MTVQILVDGWPDDVIYSQAWVEVTGDTPNPVAAILFLERKFPLEDRDEGERYTPSGTGSEWFEPMGEREGDGRYRVFDPPVTDPQDPRYGEPRASTAYDIEEGPWVECDPQPSMARHAPKDARRFWIIDVVCPT